MDIVAVNKAQAIDPIRNIGACRSVTIVIDKEWKGPDPTGKTGSDFVKAMDKEFNDQAMLIAEALQNSLPGGTWDRLVGIMNRRHASYLIINREQAEKKE